MSCLSVAAGLGRLVNVLVVVAVLLGSIGSGAVAAAQSADRDPREIAITDEEAGKATVLFADESGSDDRGRWVYRRWERDRDNEDVGVGPIITANRVWVARDVSAAQAIFRDEAGKNQEFPESVDKHEGPFEWRIEPLGDEVAALSACDDCDKRGGINLHQRVVLRRGNVVGVVYLYGRERNTTRELTRYFVDRVLERI